MKTVTFLVPESIARPLGHGYFPIEGFLVPYLESAGHGDDRSPDVSASLTHLGGGDVEMALYLQSIGGSPACLIEGISSPRNGRALRRFLESHGVPDPKIRAIDLADMKTIFELAGDPMDDVDFHVADASSLHMMQTASIDLLVQDSLLNCSPHCLHSSIMSEAARVLRPGGVAFINFTDHDGLEGRTRVPHPLPGTGAYGLFDLPAEARESLPYGVVLAESCPGRSTLVTYPDGAFEFYFPASHVFTLFERFGLKILLHRRWCGGDQHGNECHRHLTLVRRLLDG